MANDDYSRDPDYLHDDMVTARIQIVVRQDGALGVAGSINMPLPFLLAVLDNAKDAVRRHHMQMNLGKQIITPAYDAPQLPPQLVLP
jgi:hypothetical protein